MPFLSGSLGFERFRVSGFDASAFDDDHVATLEKFAAGKIEATSAESTRIGFLGGDHLFDMAFDTGKNVINDALHCSVRIDTNQIPSAIRKAWLQMELAALAQDNSSGRPTKAQRQEAKEAVEQRCETEAASGKYKKMSPFPILWDSQQNLLYFGGSGAAAAGYCADLLERAFEVELSRVTAGTIALDWARENDRTSEIQDAMPTLFVPEVTYSDVAWANEHSDNPDFLGNEFLLWLWWMTETETDTIALPDESEVTIMLNKTLSLECPLGEHGKETISAESPVKLSEAMQAVKSGKLPRKSGLTLVRHGVQYELVLQAETFAVSSAKIVVDADDEYDQDDRIDAIRSLGETVNLLFHSFCDRRTSPPWNKDHTAITDWLGTKPRQLRSSAA